ncbi:MAG: hypothetical protein HY738_17895 [Bacteroidia bacterium]|nr:hypothetical protein [Bacteroidia bacterium]
MELSKKDKKIARQIIEKGLQNEFANGLYDFDTVLHDWKNSTIDNRTAYHTLYKKIITFDKHIARRYDNMTGSKYLFIIAGQLLDGVIDEKDLDEFPEEIKYKIKLIANID